MRIADGRLTAMNGDAAISAENLYADVKFLLSRIIRPARRTASLLYEGTREIIAIRYKCVS